MVTDEELCASRLIPTTRQTQLREKTSNIVISDIQLCSLQNMNFMHDTGTVYSWREDPPVGCVPLAFFYRSNWTLRIVISAPNSTS